MGRLLNGNQQTPFVACLRQASSGRGLYVDALLLKPEHLAGLFSLSRAYFIVDMDVPSEFVAFLQPADAGKVEGRAVHLGGAAEAGQDALLPGPPGQPEALDRRVRARAGRARAGDDGVHPPLVPLGLQGHPGRVPAAQDCHSRRGPGEVPAGEVPRPRRAAAGRDGVLRRAVPRRAACTPRCSRSWSARAAQRGAGRGPAGGEAPLHRAADDAAGPVARRTPTRRSRATPSASSAGRSGTWPTRTSSPGTCLLKNFGITGRGRVVFYDYDEMSAADRRELPADADARATTWKRRRPSRGSTWGPRTCSPRSSCASCFRPGGCASSSWRCTASCSTRRGGRPAGGDPLRAAAGPHPLPRGRAAREDPRVGIG